MRTKSIKQVFEQLERIKEFADSRKRYIELAFKAYDYADNMEAFHGIKCYDDYYNKSGEHIVDYWCEEFSMPVPIEVYARQYRLNNNN